jgi:cellulose synthase/poly-beta-1,6-N-acetylglucosamine synthase-like glycosyltransferase
MTVCDDSNEKCLTSLHNLADAGYDVYILDDSASALITTEELNGRVQHIRRGARTGAKAGNLNNWLTTYGDLYEYLLLLDADSMISVEAADGLLLTAEHPDNSDAAMFQAKIEAADDGSLFAKTLSAGARPRMRVMERVHGPLGLMLSFRHNQLLRVRQVIAVGGFDESLTNEDTVISLDLAAAGQRVVLVDIWSTDTEPETVSAYIRRTLRWARQTVELFHRPWHAAPLRLKLLLCRHLLAYLLPIVGISLFGLSLWTGDVTSEHALSFWSASLTIKPGYELYGLTMWSVLGVSALSGVLRIVLARSENVPWRLLLLSAAIGKAPYSIVLMPLAGWLARYWHRPLAFTFDLSQATAVTPGRWTPGRAADLCGGSSAVC